MARRTLTFSDWMRHLRKAILSPDSLGDLGGHPVDDVATKLGVTKQRVHQLIDSDALDALVVTTKAGNVTAVIVTQASLDHYLAHRRPFRGDGRFTLTPDTP
jgi:hypothetical protein